WESVSVREAPKSSSREQLQMEITTLEMRMSNLAVRMSAPKKGDHPQALQEEYMSLAEALRLLKKQL
ncbi:MAG: hypothetical protein IJ074_11580, partial [Clostridia bacterium]|nr:hypothetical protein [Clostridia bacterium]